ncbi:MAG TPA: hypothetical protein VGC39_03855, partial [Candidatus Methylacidiphilales bacterium]
TVAVPPIAAMVMIPEPQRTVYSPDAGANGASNDSANRPRGSITSMDAFLRAANQTLRVRNHRGRHRSEESKSDSKTKFHKFSRG